MYNMTGLVVHWWITTLKYTHNNHSAKNMSLTGLTIKLTLEKSLK